MEEKQIKNRALKCGRKEFSSKMRKKELVV
jgi:hypothetical protein